MHNSNFPPPEAISFDGDYLRKTIDVKNKNIDELLRQLRQTQQLYQTIKSQYLSQQKKLKTKVSQLSSRLQLQESQLQRHKDLCAKMRGDLQLMHDRQHKINENHLLQLKQEHHMRKELEEQCRKITRENAELKDKYEVLAQRCSVAEARGLQNERTLAVSREESRQLREQMEQDRLCWQSEKEGLTLRLCEEEQRRESKRRTNRRLDDLEQKILSTINKI